jgi:hypothetical protein
MVQIPFQSIFNILDESNVPFDYAWFYSKNWKTLKRYNDEVVEILPNAITWENSNGYICLNRSQNKELFAVLEFLGFFEFHYTNKRKQIVGMHQIVLYLQRGFNKIRYHRKDVLEGPLEEIHHLDSDPKNNIWQNLVYVTAQQNSLCADAVHKPYHGLRSLNSANIKSWSEYGGGAADTAKLIKKTIVCTLQGLGFALEQLPSVANILMRLPAEIGREIIKNWRFDWNLGLH